MRPVNLFLENQGGRSGFTVTKPPGNVCCIAVSEPQTTGSYFPLFGEHAFESFVYSQSDPIARIELRPIDARLNLPAGKAFPALLEEFSQLFCVRKSLRRGCSASSRCVFGQKLSSGRFGRHQSPHEETRRRRFSGPALPNHRPRGRRTAGAHRRRQGVPLVKKTPSKCRCSKRRTSGLAIAAWPRWPARTRCGSATVQDAGADRGRPDA